MGLAYPIGGAVAAVTVAASNTATAIPTLDAGGGRPRYLVVQALGTVVVYVKTGAVGAVMTGANQGIMAQRNAGDLVLKVPRGHTHLHTWASGAGTAILAPLSARPTS